MGRILVILLFLSVSLIILTSALRSLRSPARWRLGEGHWMTILHTTREPPTEEQVRTWSVLWFLIGIAVAAIGLRVAFLLGPND